MDGSGPSIQHPNVIAVIHIGTYSSHCALSFYGKKHEIKQLNDGPFVGFPNCMIFNKDKEFVAFGIKAKQQYENADEATLKDWYFFNQFKMDLFNSIVSGDMKMEDVKGKTMPSENVMTAFIKHFLDILSKYPSALTVEDIGVVFVVPDDMRNPCKTTIMKAARSAGIPDGNFHLLGEMEVVCIWCHHKHGDILESGRCNIPCRTITDMLIVNTGCEWEHDDGSLLYGECIVDLTIHIVRSDYDSDNISQTTSWKFGTDQVDKVFEGFLSEVFGSDALDECKHELSGTYHSMLHAFYKKLFGKCENLTLHIPAQILELFEKKRNISFKNYLEGSHDKELRKGDTLTVIGKTAENLKNEAIEPIIEACKQVLTETLLYDVPTLVLYGHLAESSYLQIRVRELFSDKRIIILDGGKENSIIENGGLLYGHSLSPPKLNMDAILSELNYLRYNQT